MSWTGCIQEKGQKKKRKKPKTKEYIWQSASFSVETMWKDFYSKLTMMERQAIKTCYVSTPFDKTNHSKLSSFYIEQNLFPLSIHHLFLTDFERTKERLKGYWNQ